jgi:molecular chaperone GrpE
MKNRVPHTSSHEDPLSPPPAEKPSLEKSASASQESTPPPAAPDPITLLQLEVAKYRDQSLRAVADLENYRKRVAREKEEAIRYSNISLLEKLIPILDNFELGLEVATKNPDASASSIAVGLSMVQRQLADFVKDHGVIPVEALGQTFDAKLHEAIGHECSNELPEGSVINQLRRGYRLVDRLIRPASVIVSKGPSES